MALFKKRDKDYGREPDPELTFLTVDDGQRIRSLVREAFAAQGLEVTVYADHVRDAQGRQFGLWNVAAACHNDERGEKAWPGVVKKHVQQIIAALDAPSPFDGLSVEDAAARTYARLYEAAGLPVNLDDFPHIDFAPGLIEMLALDLPDTVAVYKKEHAERLGGWAKLREAGLANLRKEKADRLDKVEAPNDGYFHALMGESVYTASRALLMPGLAKELTGHEPGPDGWLLSVPNRHQVCWHVIRDIKVLPSINGMALFSRLGYSDAPGPLSPHVYWWSGTDYRQLTHYDEAGNVSVHVDPEFQAVLERLAESG